MLSQSAIEKKAERILDLAKVRRLPVQVDKIAAALGAEIAYDDVDDDISGALFRLETPLIAINSSHHENRQRFTIAHEIGHLVLHNEDAHTDYRDVVSSLATDPREIEANRFAAALLMPASLVKKSIAKKKLPLRGKDISALAARFQVSSQAMAIRLTNLKIPLDMIN